MLVVKKTLLIILFYLCCQVQANNVSSFPNILFILADDLGYGDVGSYNPESRIPTPNIDKLAQKGMLFTDAHSPSTVCTPTRYSVLTGRMAFRTGIKGVFDGAGGPCLIEKERLTIGGMLQKKGYTTALFGKWHVGLTFFDKSSGQPIHSNASEDVLRIDYSRSIPDAPIHRGFDFFFGSANCPTTDALYAFIDGDRIPVPPTHWLDRSPLPKHPYSHDNNVGMIAPGYDLQEMDMIFLKKSQDFLDNHSKKSKDKPFFLFHSTQAVHLPSFAGADFRGKTKSGPHGDFIFQLDHIVGELMNTIEKNGFGKNTLVIFTSDNGPEVPTIINMRKDYNHDGARPWRGVKRDNWEGGHRVPFIAYWPGKINEGSISHQTISLTDIMATVAEIIDFKLPNDAAEDSYNMLPALLGTDGNKQIRKYTLQQTIDFSMSIRKGSWKYLDHKGSGGNNYSQEGYWGMKPYILPETAPDAPAQLYNLDQDPGETLNLFFKHPNIVTELKAKLKEFKTTGRSVDIRE